jgi:gas vesicle protein
MSCFKRNISWFLMGVGVGTVVSLLFAPVGGEELQERIASAAREGADKARRQTRQASENLGDFVDRGRQQINEMVDKGQDVVENGRSQWSDYVDRGRDVISEQAEKL